MGFFSGVGRALGSAAQGFGLGQRQGEQEAYNRYKTDELLNAKLATVHGHPAKEDVPYPVKSLLDTHRAVYASGNPNAINNWEASGQGDTARQVEHAYAIGGPQAATKAFSIVTQPKGTDVSAQMAGFGQTADIPVGFGPRPAPVDASQYSFLHPSIDPNYQYKYSPKEQAQTENIQTNTARTEARTPYEIALLDAQTGNIGFNQGLAERKFNLEAGQADWDHAYKVANFLAGEGHKDLADQVSIWAPLLSASVKAAAQGGANNVATALKPFLFQHKEFGRQILNSEAASRYLQLSGVPVDQIPTILQGLQSAGLQVQGGQGAPGAATGAGPGGVPLLPRPTNDQGAGPGIPPGATTNAGIAGAQDFTRGQGFNPTPNPTGLRPDGTHGGHNEGSLHYVGRALDVGVRGKSPAEVKAFIQAAQQRGYTVRDERPKPKRPGQVWSGPHIHIEWGGQGPPAELPGMTSEQVFQAMNPGGQDVNATANAAGINTPATAPAPQNPWKDHPDSFEGQVWNQVTHGRSAEAILNDFKGTPFEAIAQHVIDAANTQQREGGTLHGTPVASRLGAQAPEGTNFAGTLGYPEVGIPKVTTAPFEPTGGFGPGTPTPKVDLPAGPGPGAGTNVSITEKTPPRGTRQFYREKNPLNARGGVNLTPKEKAGPGRDVTITPPPPAKSPQSMGPATKAPSTGAGAQIASLNPVSAGFEAGQGVRQNFDDSGVKGLLSAKPGTAMDALVRTVREHLGRTGQDEVQIHRADPRSIYDLPELKGNEKLIGWNEVFKPWAQRMGYTTTDQVLNASKWYFAQEDRLRRPPYSLTQAEAQQQLKVALESFANAPGKSLRLRVPKTGGPGNPRIGVSQTPGPGSVEYRGKGQ